ncbi:S-layer homology domain-containing protein [Bacillus sp. 1P06AnD]|uniref:S-layer homology domain-containing protein n=1 Tax=Bacillus sp. 1P06AnD TaxID=3132208 RepID=UPI00399F8BD3
MSNLSKSYRKFAGATVTASAVALVVAPLASAASFTDVAPQYKEAVDFLLSKGAEGFNEKQFGIDKEITRVDAAILLAKVLELDVSSTSPSEFTDVPKRGIPYVNALKKAGITEGKTETAFGSYDLITRGELAIWIHQGFNLKDGKDLAYTDVAPQYKEAVSALVEGKITAGTSAATFGTEQNAKRGDFAVFLHKADKVKITPEHN